MIAPVVEELAHEYDGKVKFAKVNVDFSPKTAVEYGIRGIPSPLIFKGGEPVKQIVGAVSKSVLQASLEEATGKPVYWAGPERAVGRLLYNHNSLQLSGAFERAPRLLSAASLAT